MSLRKPAGDDLTSKSLGLALCNEKLDPELWGNLLPAILEEEVISKLPFSSLVKFRAVSKRWRSVVIPYVAASSGQTSKRSGLLYFRDWSQGCLLGAGDSKCSEVRNIGRDQAESNNSNDYVLPKLSLFTNYDECKLMSSSGGLLFFTVGPVGVVKDIVAFNPLTGHSRALGLPACIRSAQDLFQDNFVSFVGVVVDAGTGKYDLVIAGADLQSEKRTFCYNSSSSEWIDGPILPPALVEIESRTGETRTLGPANMDFQSTRSVCYNGNLYWNYTEQSNVNIRILLEFRMESRRWRIIPVDFRNAYCIARGTNFHIAACKDRLFLWHAYEHPLYPHHLKFRGEPVAQSCFVEPNGSPPDSMLRAMPQEMTLGMEGLIFFDKRANAYLGREGRLRNCLVIGEGDFWYHMMMSPPSTRERSLRIVAHDTKENVYTELPRAISGNDEFYLRGFWCFSASWISP